MRRSLATGALVATLTVATAGVASADPKKGEQLDVTCTGVPSGTVLTPPNDSPWPPGLAIDGPGVYIPYQLEFSGTFYPDEGDPVDLGTEVFSKNAPRNTKSHAHGVCTFGGSEVIDDPDLGSGTVMFTGVAYVFWTGK